MKYISIKNEMLKMIREMQPNQRIPSRSFMCTKWKISRTTADKIIQELQKEGAIYCVKGSGSFVSPDKSPSEESRNESPRYHWAIILPDVTYSVYPRAFEGIERFTQAHKIDFIICNTDEDADAEFAMVQRMAASGVDGMIICPAITTTENFRNYQYLVKLGIPFVFWQRSVDYMLEIPQILLNGYYGGYLAAKQLLEKGYHRLSYIAPKRFRSAMDRYMGFCAAHVEAGVSIDPDNIRIGFDAGSEKAIIRSLLEKENAPDGFVCYVDSLALEIVSVLQEMNLRLSDDVGVIGFEGCISYLDSSLDFGLTYVDINRAESGYKAAQALWNLMHSRKEKNLIQICSPFLCIRNSCNGKKQF